MAARVRWRQRTLQRRPSGGDSEGNKPALEEQHILVRFAVHQLNTVSES